MRAFIIVALLLTGPILNRYVESSAEAIPNWSPTPQAESPVPSPDDGDNQDDL